MTLTSSLYCRPAVLLALTIAFLLVDVPGAGAAAMGDYCVVPPYLAAAVKPNVNIVMDYSGSMQFPAFLPCTPDGGSNGVAGCGSASSGAGYDPQKQYYGYFRGDRYYTYGGSRFLANSSCTQDDLIGAPDCISGNLLNWITTTRIDTVRKVLVGGRTRTGESETLESEGSTYSYTDSGLGCTFTIAASSTANRTLTIGSAGGKTCPLGDLSSANIRIKDNPAELTGIVQNYYPAKIDLEFTVFKDKKKGTIEAGKNPTISSLISAIGNEQPDGAAPMGEALWETYDFFTQSNTYSYEKNADQINSGSSVKDPFYDSSLSIRCRKSFTLLISDGIWTGLVDPVVPAYAIRTSDLRSDLSGRQQGAVYVVHAFGDTGTDIGKQGRNALILTAIFGGFNDHDPKNGYPFPFTGITPGTDSCGSEFDSTPRSNIAVGSGTSTATYCNSRSTEFPPAVCKKGSWNVLCSEWGRAATGLPYNFFEGNEGRELETALESAFDTMLASLGSGTAAALVNTPDGSGALLAQAMYHPKRDFEGEEVDWTGEVQGLWYYLDPYLDRSSIREEVWSGEGAHILDLKEDPVLSYNFDVQSGQTTILRKKDVKGDGGSILQADGETSLYDVRALWKGGKSLWSMSAADRVISTTVDGSKEVSFSAGQSAALAPYLGVGAAVASDLIRYIRGEEVEGSPYRSRRALIEGVGGIWKLGDIISSSPRLQSSVALNGYHLPPPTGYGDRSYTDFSGSITYRSRGRLFVGANDGMLHVFRTGVLSELQNGSQKARVTGAELGKEEWAYVPKGTLPYLRFLGERKYGHLSYVDGPIRIFDASIASGTGGQGCSPETYWNCRKITSLSGGEVQEGGTSWRTVVIAGTGLGGASREGGIGCAGSSCVEAPLPDPAKAEGWIGYSTYFALDVSDKDSPPKLMWEFSGDPAKPGTLGFTTTGPAIVRVGNRDRNGRWFAVFASGPTGPIDTGARQFLGRSDQQLRIFVVDVATGTLIRTIEHDFQNNLLPVNAFAGSLSSSVVDADRWNPGSDGFYSDDAVYIGYVEKSGAGTWTKGGVLRLSTKESNDPKDWSVSRLISDIGPVTTSVTKLQDRNNGTLWLYFGTGRYFFRTTTETDSADAGQALYGVKEPCYSGGNFISKSCTTAVSSNSLLDQTKNPSSVLNALPSDNNKGWLVNLDGSSTTMSAERVITDPVAAHTGAVFFTTYRPAKDPCSFGESYVWALRYDTGGTPPAGSMKGKALLQVSTGVLKDISLSQEFGAKDGRRTTEGVPGVPPASQGLGIMARPRPARQLLHVQER